jgi:pimeloyl-ACP methyl ester carboxylesterase
MSDGASTPAKSATPIDPVSPDGSTVSRHGAELASHMQRIEIRAGRVISLLHLQRPDPNSNETFHSDITMFFYHGAMASWTQFEDLIVYYRNRFNIVAYDALGCGNSDKPVDPLIWGDSHYTSDQLMHDAVAVFAAFATERNILVGHSFGSAIVARVARSIQKSLKSRPRKVSDAVEVAEPEAVRSLASARIFHPQVVASILLGTHLAPPLARHPVFFLPVFILDVIQDMLTDQFVELAFSPQTSSDIKAQCRGTSQKNSMHVTKSFYSNFGWAKEKDWATLAQHPVCVCQGKDDLLTPIDGSAELFRMIVKNAPMNSENGKTNNLYEVFEGAGHQIMQEKPEELIRVINSFLSEKCEMDS